MFLLILLLIKSLLLLVYAQLYPILNLDGAFLRINNPTLPSCDICHIYIWIYIHCDALIESLNWGLTKEEDIYNVIKTCNLKISVFLLSIKFSLN